MKILITGASGFVGTHLCERLLNEGHQVIALVRSPAKFNKMIDSHPSLAVIQGDLDHKDLEWTQLLPNDLHTCIHTAGIVHSYRTDHFFQTNAKGTAFLVENLAKKFPELHFVLISSLAAAGPSLGPEKRTEDDLDFPISIYGRSKKKAEDYLKELAPPGWKLAIVRPPMIIGPRDVAVLDIFKMVRSRFIILAGMNSRTKVYSFVCVFDLIDTLTLVVNQNKTGLYYSAHPHSVTFNQLIQTIKKQMGIRILFHLPLPLFVVKLIASLLYHLHRFFPHQLRLTPDKYFELAATNWTCESKKSEIELGQIYHYGLNKTIEMTYEDYRQRNWL